MNMIRPPVPEGEAGVLVRVSGDNWGDSLSACLPVLPSDLCFDADSTRLGRVALRVLYDPRTSISITALKALELNCVIGARKFPAAPALFGN